MNTKKKMIQTTVLFTGLSIAGAGVVIGANFVDPGSAQATMISFGSVVFGAGLTFFLIRMTSLLDQ